MQHVSQVGGILLITTHSFDFTKEILQGINQAKATNKSILVSIVNKIDEVEPLEFFKAGHHLFFGERFFWKEATAEHYFVGLGISSVIQTNKTSDRFSFVEKEWSQLLEQSIVINPYKVEGVGPLIFGGFSFDPYKEKTTLWNDFSDSVFHLPTFLLSQMNGETFLTTNIICSKNDDVHLAEKTISNLNEIFSNKNNDHFSYPKINKEVEINPDQWKSSITKAVNELKTAETLKKVVLARELRLYFDDDVAVEQVLPHLLSEQTDSYIFALESNGDCFIGATPERLVKKNEETVYTTCLAGSIARGKTEEEDQMLGETLLNDEKNLIEHQYVVDMISEAMEETCNQVIIPDKPMLLKVRDIQHLHTPVVGKSKQGTSLFALVDRLHPTPALGGLPKKEAVEKIREIEVLDRGLYSGPIGWMDYKGNGEFAVAIRSGLIQGKEASLFAGCGVVVNSNAEAEYLETSIKFRPMLTALGRK